MYGRPHSYTNSWVVSKESGRPTGYSDADLDPRQLATVSPLIDDRRGDCVTGWPHAFPPDTFALSARLREAESAEPVLLGPILG